MTLEEQLFHGSGHDLGTLMFINNFIGIGYNIGMFSMSRTIEKMSVNKQ